MLDLKLTNGSDTVLTKFITKTDFEDMKYDLM